MSRQGIRPGEWHGGQAGNSQRAVELVGLECVWVETPTYRAFLQDLSAISWDDQVLPSDQEQTARDKELTYATRYAAMVGGSHTCLYPKPLTRETLAIEGTHHGNGLACYRLSGSATRSDRNRYLEWETSHRMTRLIEQRLVSAGRK